MSRVERPDRGSPTTTLIGVLVVVFLFQRLLEVFGGSPVALALAWPIADRPWTLLTSVFVHRRVFHLVPNALALFVIGLVLERRTEPWRFYAFFLVVGAVAGAMEVTVAQALGRRVAVLGASGAVFGLFGYLLAGNPFTDAVADRISVDPRVAILVVIGVALAITWLTRGERVALIAHFTGIVLGLLAGRAHVLRSSESGASSISADRRRP
ncbi:Conserved membrane protein in rhomboid family protein [Halorhabdus tiamatea SARL4B]|uniref:Rhomboid family protein n=1 Tax=Halorhabdus tiamatea SARL4B TaxID=1033806 RepID=F7PHH4_9EURY|nr:rhomboid family intramembrane serine protease [Halorhabdus tiamatea]ERJ06785.1 Conserved membrane protein in rhomboid family protein [Halorhabdus tiamatea SARL4B]CCQ33708.1 rhomboid family protein [Halorhabdus tiamatea SARL4B]